MTLVVLNVRVAKGGAFLEVDDLISRVVNGLSRERVESTWEGLGELLVLDVEDHLVFTVGLLFVAGKGCIQINRDGIVIPHSLDGADRVDLRCHDRGQARRDLNLERHAPFDGIVVDKLSAKEHIIGTHLVVKARSQFDHLMVISEGHKSGLLTGAAELAEYLVVDSTTDVVAVRESSGKVKLSDPRPSSNRDRLTESQFIVAKLRCAHYIVEAGGLNRSEWAGIVDRDGELLRHDATLLKSAINGDARLDLEWVAADVVS